MAASPTASPLQTKKRRGAALFFGRRHAVHDARTTTNPPRPSVNPRYGTWVWAQNDPATTATGNNGRSSSATDHNARRKTMNDKSGRYGFHACVRVSAP